MPPAGRSSTKGLSCARYVRAGSRRPVWTSSRTSPRSIRACCHCGTWCWRLTSRAPPVTPVSPWQRWPCAIAWGCSRESPRSRQGRNRLLRPTLETSETIAESVERTPRHAGDPGLIERLSHDAESGAQVSTPVLVVFRQFLPGSHVEDTGRRRRLPQGAGRIPAGTPLLPSRETKADAVALRAVESGAQRALIVSRGSIRVASLPEAPDSGQFRGAQIGI